MDFGPKVGNVGRLWVQGLDLEPQTFKTCPKESMGLIKARGFLGPRVGVQQLLRLTSQPKPKTQNPKPRRMRPTPRK